MSKPSMIRSLSKKLGKKKEDGTDVTEEPLARTSSSSVVSGKNDESGSKPSPLARTLSSRLGKKKEDGTDATEEEKPATTKPSLGRTLSQRFSRKSGEQSGSASEDEGEVRLGRVCSLALM